MLLLKDSMGVRVKKIQGLGLLGLGLIRFMG